MTLLEDPPVVASAPEERVERVELSEVSELPPSERGAGGFGSTGT